MQIYNARNIDRNSRFIIAMIVGFICALGLGFFYGAIKQILPIEMEIFYILIGYAIAYIVRYFGRGVTLKFAVLGAILCVIAIIVGDVVGGYGLSTGLRILITPSYWSRVFMSLIVSRLSTIWGLLALVFRIAGVYTAYMYSRIL